LILVNPGIATSLHQARCQGHETGCKEEYAADVEFHFVGKGKQEWLKRSFNKLVVIWSSCSPTISNPDRLVAERGSTSSKNKNRKRSADSAN
jgi:hypothetical protein